MESSSKMTAQSSFDNGTAAIERKRSLGSDDSEERTLNALQQTSKELDCILNDLRLEASRNSDDAMPNDDYDSDDDGHGEQELKAELDSLALTLRETKNQDLCIAELPPHSKPLMDKRMSSGSDDLDPTLNDLEQQTPLVPPPAEYAPTSSPLSQLSSDDDSVFSHRKSVSSSTVSVQSSLAVVLASGWNSTNESTASGMMVASAILQSQSYTKKSRGIWLQLACALISLALLIGIAAALFVTDDGDSSQSSSIAAAVQRGPSPAGTIITPSPTKAPTATSWLEGVNDFLNGIDAPIGLPAGVLPTTPADSVSYQPTSSPTFKTTISPTTREPTTTPSSGSTPAPSSESTNSEDTKKKGPKKDSDSTHNLQNGLRDVLFEAPIVVEAIP